jgi:hypothetical protein
LKYIKQYFKLVDKLTLSFIPHSLLGSVERGNSTIKKIISDVCGERKKEGKTDNWVLCLGCIMTGLNTHRGQMANAVSSYRTLFGCDYHCITSSTLQDAMATSIVKNMVPLIMNGGQFLSI